MTWSGAKAAMGKSGSVTALLKTLGSLTPEERSVQGPRLNGLREAVAPVRPVRVRAGALLDATAERHALVGRLAQRAAAGQVRDHHVVAVAATHMVARALQRLSLLVQARY